MTISLTVSFSRRCGVRTLLSLTISSRIINLFTAFLLPNVLVGSGGVAMLIRNSISYNIIDSTNVSNYFNILAEYLVVDISFNQQKYRVYVFYRHPTCW